MRQTSCSTLYFESEQHRCLQTVLQSIRCKTFANEEHRPALHVSDDQPTLTNTHPLPHLDHIKSQLVLSFYLQITSFFICLAQCCRNVVSVSKVGDNELQIHPTRFSDSKNIWHQQATPLRAVLIRHFLAYRSITVLRTSQWHIASTMSKTTSTWYHTATTAVMRPKRSHGRVTVHSYGVM